MNKKGDFFDVIIPVGIVLFIFLFILLIFPTKIIQTTSNGEHTGTITAIETDGIIFKTNSVYFKTDAQSSQEDRYCIVDSDLKEQLSIYQKNKTTVTIIYEDYLIIGYPLCNSDDSGIIIGVEEESQLNNDERR